MAASTRKQMCTYTALELGPSLAWLDRLRITGPHPATNPLVVDNNDNQLVMDEEANKSNIIIITDPT